jgi:hypothetical protein
MTRGQKNHLPSSARIDGTTSARTTRVSIISPTAMVVPIWAMLSTLLPSNASMVSPKTTPAVVTTLFGKLDLRDRAAAIVYAYDNGVVAPR